MVTLEPNTPEHEIARLPLTGDAGPNASAADVMDAANPVLEQLHGPLVQWMGRDGSVALLSRYIEQARPVHRTLAAARVLHVDVDQPPRLAGVWEPADGHDAEETRAALVSVVAAMIALLSRLVGANLVMRLLRQTWPDSRLQAAVRSRDASLAPSESVADGRADRDAYPRGTPR